MAPDDFKFYIYAMSVAAESISVVKQKACAVSAACWPSIPRRRWSSVLSPSLGSVLSLKWLPSLPFFTPTKFVSLTLGDFSFALSDSHMVPRPRLNGQHGSCRSVMSTASLSHERSPFRSLSKSFISLPSKRCSCLSHMLSLPHQLPPKRFLSITPKCFLSLTPTWLLSLAPT